MKVAFSDKKATDLKPENSRKDYRDTKVPELHLRVYPTGRKVWMLRISNRGKWSSSVIGVFRETPTADIELEAEDARYQARHELALAGKQGSLNRDEAAIAAMPCNAPHYSSLHFPQ